MDFSTNKNILNILNTLCTSARSCIKGILVKIRQTNAILGV
jgi:hypothetical protein